VKTGWIKDRRGIKDVIQTRALATWQSWQDPLEEQLLHAAMGLAGESGEFLDKIKKLCFKPGYSCPHEDLVEELGDVLYYLAILSHALGETFGSLSAKNHDKLSGGKHGWEGEDRGPAETPESAEKKVRDAIEKFRDSPAQLRSVIQTAALRLGKRVAVSVVKDSDPSDDDSDPFLMFYDLEKERVLFKIHLPQEWRYVVRAM